MKKFLFVIASLGIFFLFSHSAAAVCYWETLTTTSVYSGPGMAPSTSKSGGCGSSATQKTDESACSTTVKPSYAANSDKIAVCCCDYASENSAAKKAIFTPPDLQIKIPGMEKLSKISCDEDGQCEIPWLGQYIVGLYGYALTIAGILAAIMLMAGGLLWLISAGDASKITRAQELIAGSVTGLIILATSFIILVQINPKLVNFGALDLSVIKRYDIIPNADDPVSFSQKCVPQTTGPCAVSNMGIFGDRANEASAICNAESGGNPGIYNRLTKCTGGEYAVWGLFQFNLSDNDFVDEENKTLHCKKAFNHAWTNSNPTCTVIDKALYDSCVKAAITPELSIKNAKRLSGGSNWGPWEANSKWCKFKK